MTDLQISVPESLFAALRKAPHEVGREIRIAASIHWYQQSTISMELAAEFAQMSRAEFLRELARRHVDVFVTEAEDLARELRGAAFAVDTPAEPRRIGFLKGEIEVPDDFDRMV